jgi:hypothetical protein
MFCCAHGWARGEKKAKEKRDDAREQANKQDKHGKQEGERERLLVDKKNDAASPIEHEPDERGDNSAPTHGKISPQKSLYVHGPGETNNIIYSSSRSSVLPFLDFILAAPARKETHATYSTRPGFIGDASPGDRGSS